ncbi:hypothetical protein Q5741_09150 [Paenibacillus sp. JX-17]|uniref:YhfM-like domain-containing protein n=1 Tax=Paenibacillus lacisoli TaxID=3064525 RepID=A0ABT9CBF7_9BACL|nr:hypothetical protein [Paenibacillus sp. JX-17]MDO7906586.1 hypothetical protein [Paenibacillus sp. JX-17]
MNSRQSSALILLLSMISLGAAGCGSLDRTSTVQRASYTYETKAVHVTDPKTIENLADIMQSGRKRKCVVDIGPAEEKLTLRYGDHAQQYDLYLNRDTGEGWCLDPEDTNHLYELPKHAYKQLAAILQAIKESAAQNG